MIKGTMAAATMALILGPSIAQALTIDPFTTAFDTGVPVIQTGTYGEYLSYYGQDFTTPYGGIAQERRAQAFDGSTTRISSTGNGVANVTLGSDPGWGPGLGLLEWSNDISYQTQTPLNLGGTKAFRFNVTDWNGPVNSTVNFALFLWDGIERDYVQEVWIEHTVSGSGMLEFNFDHVSEVNGDVEWAQISFMTLGMYRTDDSSDDISFNISSVPDGGMTLVLLGGALTGLGALRRKFRA